jgi:hypothetical protein
MILDFDHITIFKCYYSIRHRYHLNELMCSAANVETARGTCNERVREHTKAGKWGLNSLSSFVRNKSVVTIITIRHVIELGTPYGGR